MADELTIFISYRRADTRADAGRLYDALTRRFGRDQLFMDVDSLMPGEDWVEAVEKAVEQSDVLLAVIGDEWSSVVDSSGKRRIDDDLDRVRLEIEAALKRDKPVIPVLFGDAHMPEADELPDSLQPLRRRHAMRVAHDNFRADLEPLVHSLRSIEMTKRQKLGLPARGERGGRRAHESGVDRTVTAATPAPAARVEAPPLAAQAVPPIAAAKTRVPITPLPAPPPPRSQTQQQKRAPTPRPTPAPTPTARPAPAPAQPATPVYQAPTSQPQPTYRQPTYPYGQPAQWQQPVAPVYQQSAYGQQPGYPQQWGPGVQKTGLAANPLSIVAIVLAVIGILIPYICGVIAIVLGVIARSRKEPWADPALGTAVVCTFVGFGLLFIALATS